MIFFNVPSVGQTKPETIFGHDDHFGFIQTLIGEKYNRENIRLKCQEYYNTDNQRYWDQIITLINFLGIKKINLENEFEDISLLNVIAEKYDSNDLSPSKALFDYLLCLWQFPHPISTTTRAVSDPKLDLYVDNPRKFPITKPYAVILKLLLKLYKESPSKAYLSNEEFYWLGYSFYESSAVSYKNIDQLFDDIINIRKNGWDKFDKIRDLDGTATHLSYPKGFLRNSYVLSTDSELYGINKNDFFIGVKHIENIEKHISVIINLTESLKFNFDHERSVRDLALCYDFTTYLYDKNKFSKWLNETGYYDVNHNLLENVVNVEREFKLIDIARKKVEIQMTRLVNLDRKTITRKRTEQHLLRDYLFNHKKQGECAICNNQYPISFLATAHIKKRSKCTDQEKKDFKVVMPACHLGCDKVYEDGYVIVKDGIIKNNITSKPSTDDLRTFISSITDNKCKYYDNETAKYFKYHAKQHN